MEEVIETPVVPKNKDATIELIDSINVHTNADKLELVMILGYQCVSQKGLYKAGDKIVYIRPDSLLPVEPWTEDYRKYSPKRIKAVKLRGEVSKGIIVPFELLPAEIRVNVEHLEVGTDVSALIGVTHYEEPVPQDLQAKGGLPLGIPYTDEERSENMKKYLPFGEAVDVSLKIDGQSSSFFYDLETDRFGIVGRKLEYHEIFSNNYTDHVPRYNIKEKLIAYCKKHNVSLCIRGESYGQGIQGNENNPHSKLDKGWAMFSVFNIGAHEHAEKGNPHYYVTVAKELDLPTVPMIEENVILTPELIKKYASDLKKVNGLPFEGVVVKFTNGSFKIINDDYDSKK